MDKIKLDNLPEKPGVYIYKDASGKIIYIGKAKSLKNRVRSYFNAGKKDIKTEKLVPKIADLDYIVTRTEIEAFLLEASLVKQHKPYYNILLKDDKSFPFIKITAEKYPGVYLTRQTREKNAVYFGPYFANDAKKVLKLIYRAFKVRQCLYKFDEKPLKRPCIYYDTGFCSAPCTRLVSEEAYNSSIKEVRSFLNGNYKKILENLKVEMDLFSEKRLYENAAEARDAIKAVEGIMTEQKVVDSEDKNMDAVNYVYRDSSYYFCVLSIRSGRLISRKIDVFSDTAEQEGAFELYLSQYYGRAISYPAEIILPAEKTDAAVAAEIFREKGVKTALKKRDNLLKMALLNIDERIRQVEAVKERMRKAGEKYAEQIRLLQENLNMRKPPSVIDCIDISHLHGENTVASCVVFRDAEPDRQGYRRYRIKTVKKIDDFDSVREVVMRRYGRMLKEEAEFPDLILIDGGIGQVNAAKEALDMVGVEDAELIGLAKREEQAYKPGKNRPVPLSAGARHLLMRVRDEAHRFALSYQTLLANKKMKESVFDGISFLGEKTIYRIYSEFGDTAELLAAIEENSERADFLSKRQKENIIKKLKKGGA
ncbi:MAG TPA: excinuclease ABC subunit UvrC [Candidatus Goldiibacteriota bacterium]|nr:excinuclease ABC subunit UvrC [Candidatus Goldiibacteriota bacterium]